MKKERVLNQFTLIKDRPQLNTVREDLQKSPLKFFGEFVSYSGGDGQALGVVLTPRYITELFGDLVDLKPTDVLFEIKTTYLIQFKVA